MDRRPRVARKVSIKDIARKAEVDPSTVSRALKNSPWIGPHHAGDEQNYDLGRQALEALFRSILGEQPE